MSVYSQALLLLSPFLALTFWLAAGLLFRQARRMHQGRRRLGSLLWCGHAAVYWTANAVLRLFFGYAAPTLAISAWASILFIHAAFSMLWMAAFLLRYESSPDSSR
jgi:hypothetical protein